MTAQPSPLHLDFEPFHRKKDVYVEVGFQGQRQEPEEELLPTV
jgi:hypothetical protein